MNYSARNFLLLLLFIFLIISGVYRYSLLADVSLSAGCNSKENNKELILRDIDREILECKTVYINKATVGELMRIKGIGPVLASNIVEYRDLHGAFVSVEEIMQVKGIGPKKFEKMKEFIRID